MVGAGRFALDRWTGLWPILLLALALRVTWALLVPVHPISDAATYDMFARNIAAGRGYVFNDGSPTVYWPVGPSALYGVFYALFGPSGWVVAVVNIVMGCGIVAGIYRIGLQRFDARVAALAALIAAVWPVWIQFVTMPSSELSFALFKGLPFAAFGEQRLPRWVRTLLSTALLVIAAFMRPTIVPLILLLPLLGGSLRQPLRTAGNVVLALVLAALLFAPWMERNRALFGEPVLVSANFGANLWMGNNPQSHGRYMALPAVETKNEVTRDAHFKALAVTFIRENPGEFLRLCVKRIAISFDRETIGIVWNARALSPAVQWAGKLVSTAYWLAVLAMAIVGVALWLLQNPARLFDPLVVAPAMFAAVALIVVGQDRYHMPMMPFIALFAAYAIVRLAFRPAKRAAVAWSRPDHDHAARASRHHRASVQRARECASTCRGGRPRAARCAVGAGVRRR